jgi:two-component system response regulator YesN
MYRLLIVDNEPNIVRGLHILFQEVSTLELDIYCAYSAEEALSALVRIKIDIVLSDIRMPGMSGLDLQQRILEQWPRCKIIFLTGYNDFTYVQSAFRQGSVDYLLKTDGEEKIVSAVEKAALDLAEELEMQQMIENARDKMHLAAPVLLREFLLNIVEGEKLPGGFKQELFAKLNVPLSPNDPLLLVLGRIDAWPEGMLSTDRALFIYAIQNIVEEYLSECHLISVTYDRNQLIWFIQPRLRTDLVLEEAWEKTIRFVHGTMDPIQATCKSLLKLAVSFAMASRECQWPSSSITFANLKKVLILGLGQGQEMLLTDFAINDLSKQLPVASDKPLNYPRQKMNPIGLLEAYLESGQKTQFFQRYHEMMALTENELHLYSYIIETYYSIAVFFLVYINKWGLSEPVAAKLDFDKLMKFEAHGSWIAAVQYLEKVANYLFNLKEEEKEARTHQLVSQVKHYIEAHLSGDVSLAKLAEVVYLNPTYLCRLYKQITGGGLTEYITTVRLSKAMELLKIPHLKVQDIARTIGFDSASYFGRFFKKEMNMTPQEYREHVNK